MYPFSSQQIKAVVRFKGVNWSKATGKMTCTPDYSWYYIRVEFSLFFRLSLFKDNTTWIAEEDEFSTENRMVAGCHVLGPDVSHSVLHI